MKDKLVIPPQGKRKHKIIFKTTFSKEYKKNGELDDVLSKTLGSFGVF